ncbi:MULTISPECIES: Rv3235 family protein [unclassified Gordonia (in: high G+C Gram-positive bacteria)]
MDSPRIRILPAPSCERAGSAVGLVDPHHDSTLHHDRTPSRPAAPPVPQRPPSQVPPTGSRTVAAATLEARRFAIATVSLAFEVIDRRRSLTHVQPRVAPAVLDQLGVLVRTNVARSGADGADGARMRRVHIQMCGSGAAEIFGSYARGPRVRAFAGRIERLPCRVRTPQSPGDRRYQNTATKVEYRWQLVSFILA